MKAVDAYSNLSGHITDLTADGIQAVFRYIFTGNSFKTQLTRAEVDAYHAAGIAVGLVWEKGSPTNDAYFSTDRGVADSQGIHSEYARLLVPDGVTCWTTADYDASYSAVKPYYTVIHPNLENARIPVGCYGDGSVLEGLQSDGLADHLWLTQSRGFPGRSWGLAYADVIQGPAGVWHGFDIDTDVVNRDPAAIGLWLPNGVSIAPSPAPVAHPLLMIGDTGDDVARLQRVLGIPADGIFGPNTRFAVVNYQRLHGLAADGVVGPRTWAALEPTPTS